ncbi:hypothetical protein ACIF6I_35935 [Streptomyces microflavus]|uniref:hypothetical protein n=1 Tax=Streptomyces microflavus TaxID=1919 RepID=UPI0037CD8631
MVSQPRRSYSNATIAALTTLARGGCYYPGCNVPILRLIDGEPFLNLEIAHIRAFEDNGPRPEEAAKDQPGCFRTLQRAAST